MNRSNSRYRGACMAFAFFMLAGISPVAVGAVEPANEAALVLKPPLVALNTPEGRQLLLASNAQEAYWSLLQNFESQQDKASCSVASSVMVLNALKIARPASAPISPYRLFTPANLFNSDVAPITTQAKVSLGGMTLAQLHAVISKFDVTARLTIAGGSDEATFRRTLVETLAAEGCHIIVNYYRPVLGQQGGGHISPLAAYNEAEDMVLVADTASFKYPWTWVPVSKLWEAMAKNVDPLSRKTRGYVIVCRNDQPVDK